jgi:hypothetical protein
MANVGRINGSPARTPVRKSLDSCIAVDLTVYSP